MPVHARVPLGQGAAHAHQPLDRLGDVGGPPDEVLEGLLLLGRVGRDPLVPGVVALEEVGHQHEGVAHVLRQPVGALERLAGEAEGVVDGDDGARRAGRAGDVCDGGEQLRGALWDCERRSLEEEDDNGNLQVFSPSKVSYFPFSLCSADTGGISLHALQDMSCIVACVVYVEVK